MSLTSKLASKVLSAGNRFVKEVAAQTTGHAKKAQPGTAQSQQRQGSVFSGLNARAGGAKAHPEGSPSQPRVNLQSFRPGSPQGAPAGLQQRMQTSGYQAPQPQQFTGHAANRYQQATTAAPAARQQTSQPVGLQHLAGGAEQPPSKFAIHRPSVRPESKATMAATPSANGRVAPQSARQSPSRPERSSSQGGSVSGAQQRMAKFEQAKAYMDGVIRLRHQMDGALDNPEGADFKKLEREFYELTKGRGVAVEPHDPRTTDDFDRVELLFDALSAEKPKAVAAHNQIRDEIKSRNEAPGQAPLRRQDSVQKQNPLERQNEIARSNIPAAKELAKDLSRLAGLNSGSIAGLTAMTAGLTYIDVGINARQTLRRHGGEMRRTVELARQYAPLQGRGQELRAAQKELRALLGSDKMEGLRRVDPQLEKSLRALAQLDVGKLMADVDSLQDSAKLVRTTLKNAGASGLFDGIRSTPAEAKARKEEEERRHQEQIDNGYL